MDLFEYQARDIFDKHGMKVLPGKVAHTPEEAYSAAVELGADDPDKIVVVKAQVKTGGRGKAGGVKLAKSSAEAKQYTEDILGMDINGHTVHRVMIVAGADIDEEYYFSILLDRTNRSLLCMCSKEGGMDIETLAVERPEALAKISVDPLKGIDRAKAEEIYAAAGFTDNREDLINSFIKMWEIYRDEDATLVEVNPLVRTTSGEILALDGKVTIDSNAEFRHPEHAALVDEKSEDPLESLAKELHLNYVKLDGSVGIIGNGAGLVMSTLDVVAYAGEDLPGKPHPANFLDIGGGASAKVMADGLSVIIGDEQVKSVFVNVFGGITACDEVANGIVQALDMLGDKATKPLVVRLDGNAVTEGRRILAERNHPLVTVEETMDGAAVKAAELAVAK